MLTTGARRRDHLADFPRLHGRFPPLDLQRAHVLVAHDTPGRRPRRGADHDLTGERRGLQPLGRIHDVAHRRVVAAGAQRSDEHLTGVDPDTQLRTGTAIPVQLGHGALHLERAPNGAFGVVLVGDRRAEQRDERIADKLVDAAAVPLDVRGERGETPVDEVFDAFRIGRLGERREPDEVAEEHCDDAALVGAGDQRLSANRTEVGTLGRGGAARRAVHGPRIRGAVVTSPWILRTYVRYTRSHGRERTEPAALAGR